MTARALILANGRFADAGIPPLRSPVPDGERLQALLERGDVFPYEVLFKPDLSAQEARVAVYDFCQGASSDDQLLLFISGHGLKDAQGKLYFATADTQKTKLRATTLEANYVIECLQECAARKQIMILDTCYSGAFARGITYKSAAVTVTVDDFAGDWAGRAVLTATTAVQLAGEADTNGFVQSRFTAALISGIESGSADRRRSGQITLGDLHAHTRDALKGSGQQPQLFNEKLTGDVVIAKSTSAMFFPEHLQGLVSSGVARDRAEAVDHLFALARTAEGSASNRALEQLREFENADDSLMVQAAAERALKRLGKFRSPENPKASGNTAVGIQDVRDILADTAVSPHVPDETAEFDVLLTADGGRKIDVIKEVRALIENSLTEAKALVESLPQAVKKGVSKAEAEKIKKRLVSAGASVELIATPGSAFPVQGSEETIEFDVVLTRDGGKKINVIKEVRAITGNSLTEAKTLVESLPQVVKKGVSKVEAEKLKRQLETAGASVELK